MDTPDTTWRAERLIDVNVTVLRMEVKVKTGRDTIYRFESKGKKGKKKQSPYGWSEPILRTDTISLALSDLRRLRKDWFKNKEWAYPFLVPWMLATVGVLALPVAVIADGEQGFDRWAMAETVLLGIGVPPLVISVSTTRYDLRKKWKFVNGGKIGP